jgi:hypothetical protein
MKLADTSGAKKEKINELATHRTGTLETNLELTW